MVDLIPGNYLVYLHRGCTLHHHKLAVKRAAGDIVDLDTAIQGLIPEDQRLGLVYEAQLSSDGLAAVRADRAVAFVECDCMAYLAALSAKGESSRLPGL